MRKIFVLFALLAISSLSFAQRTGKMVIGDGECEYDTLIHRSVAPGVTFTQFQFNSLSRNYNFYKMRVHLTTVDVTNPYNSFVPYISHDTYYTADKQNNEIEYRRQQGQKPVVSMMGSFFQMLVNIGSTRTGYEVPGGLVVNGEIKYEESWNSRMFYMDDKAHIGNISFRGSVTSNGTSYNINQINHHRDLADSRQEIALFCNGVPKSVAASSTIGKGVDVRVRLLNDDFVKIGKTQCEVIEIMQGCGHSVGANEAILSGTGKAASFLLTLMKGETISIDLNYFDSKGNSVDMKQGIPKAFGYGIVDGKISPSTQENYALCAIGCSEDGRYIYMASLENSPNSSAGVQCFLEFMQNVGAYNLMCLDGGPSAEMTVDGSFVTQNVWTGEDGRYVPNGMIVYSTAPDDNQLSHVECADASFVTMKCGQSFNPVLYGYNQYGEMIMPKMTDVSGLTFTCSDEIGNIDSDGRTFKATQPGRGYIYIKVKSSGEVLTIPVTVLDTFDFSVHPKTFYTCRGRQCEATLNFTRNEIPVYYDKKDLKWSTNNTDVIQSCADGIIVPNADGRAEVYVQYDEYCDTMTVVVETVSDKADYLDLSDQLYFHDVEDIQIPGIPRSFVLTLQARQKGDFSLLYKKGEKECVASSDHLDGGDIWECKIELNPDEVESYPVILQTIEANANYRCEKLVVYYTDHVKGDVNNDGQVDISDVTLLVSAYVEGGEIDTKTCDIDEDGSFTVSDIVALVSLYLNK